MEYLVEMTAEAEAEGEQVYLRLREQSPPNAVRWLKGLHEAINLLKTNPGRCTLAPENDVFDEEIRQLLYGRRRGIYRILFTIHGDTVYVLHIRHGARKRLAP